MEKTWKMYVTDAGLNSYQNEMLEQRDFYRVLVFLQNSLKGRMSERKINRRSFLFQLVRMIQQETDQTERDKEYDKVTEYDSNIRTFYIDGTPVYIGWSSCGGVSITAQSAKGNTAVTEIADLIQDHDVWWNR